jgi:deoxyribodipyrimidine photolyase-related protein
MKKAVILFPNQMFEHSLLHELEATFFLVEEFLFFKQFLFHKQKLLFHRVSMKKYELYLKSKDLEVKYIESVQPNSDLRILLPGLLKEGFDELYFHNPTDDWLLRRITKYSLGLKLTVLPDPNFINNRDENEMFFKGKKRFFQAEFYKSQRKKTVCLVDENLEPVGGKWSFDEDNRKKYPKNKVPPFVNYPLKDESLKHGFEYIQENFSENLGTLEGHFCLPNDFASAKVWLEEFLEQRFHEFGDFEDAIVSKETLLHHSLLSPLINSGLLSPSFVLNRINEFAESHSVNINAHEGLVRQIIGWREFIRAVYDLKGRQERTRNFWNFKRKMPRSFYDGSTGIVPFDTVIKKVIKIGYCHHIERLMVLGNFMLLCEIDPDEVYQWFMELFVDAYDWVMVPNVYGMSQFADGGLMSTKPYFSGSNYLMKMSDYEKGQWQEVWDGLYWRFIDKQRDFMKKNPRLNMMVSMFDNMEETKKSKLVLTAEKFLKNLDSAI